MVFLELDISIENISTFEHCKRRNSFVDIISIERPELATCHQGARECCCLIYRGV